MKINKWTAFAIGILIIAGMGFAGATIPQGNPFVIRNLTTGINVAWIDREGNLNISGNFMGNLLGFDVTGTLGGGNLTADSVTGTQIDESTLVGVPTFNQTYHDFVVANVSRIAEDLTCTDCIGGTEVDESTLSGVPWTGITGYDLDTVWTGTLLPSGNLTACDTGEILKIAGGLWTCAADDTGVAVDAYVNTTGDTITGNITLSSGTGFNATTGAAIIYDGTGGFIVTLV